MGRAAKTVGQVGHLPYHFLVVHTGNDVAVILSEIYIYIYI